MIYFIHFYARKTKRRKKLEEKKHETQPFEEWELESTLKERFFLRNKKEKTKSANL